MMNYPDGMSLKDIDEMEGEEEEEEMEEEYEEDDFEPAWMDEI